MKTIMKIIINMKGIIKRVMTTKVKIKFNCVVIASMVLIGASLNSCSKVLDLTPQDAISEDAVWTDPALTQVFVNQIYRESVLTFKDAGYSWGAQTDELYSNFNWCNENEYVLGQATPDNQSSSFPLNYSSTINFWSTLYSTIQKTNIFFQNIEKVDTTGAAADISNMKGEVHFLRALCYFELLKRFGGVPLITKVYTSADKTFTEARASWDETRDYILSEITAAIALLPKAYASSSDNGKATIGACLALKSRLLLYAASPAYNPTNDRSRWQAAADAAKAVIDLGQYALYGEASDQSLNKVFLDPFNSEVIFARVFSGTSFEDRYNTVFRDLSPNGYNGYSAYNVLEQMVEAFQMKDGTAFSWKIPAEAKDPYANRDPRFYADVLYNGAPYKNRTAQFYTGGLDSKTSSLSPWNASKTGYTIRKMIDESYDFNNQEYSKCQWVVFRLAEIYLNYAEASAELGNTADALKYVNLIRKRADMPDLTAANLVDKIRQERRIELCFEGHRYFDLRRWNLAETGAGDALGIQITPTSAANTSFTYKTQVIEDRVWKPALTLYPIPRSEIQKNPNIKQNPGYK